MNQVMLDLETLSLKPNALIVAIGAVAFNLESDQVTCFYQTIEYDKIAGFDVDYNTVKWWMNQDSEAKRSTFKNGIPLSKALEEFGAFYRAAGASAIWSNGADFDLPILAHAYSVGGYKGPPWQYNATRCFRTIRAVFKDRIKIEPKKGVHHNALDDAKWQLANLRQIFGVQ